QQCYSILTIALPDTHHGVTKCTRATINSVTAESMPHFPHAVDAVIIPMNSTNAVDQHSITKATST
ncbi:hypothetical protein QP827_06800, partial [Corynebacterium imitans]